MSHVIPLADREASAERAGQQLNALRHCVTRLLKQGIRIVAYRAHGINGQDRVTVEASPSPKLHSLYAGRCAAYKRRQEGAHSVFTWCAIDENDIRVEWEEVSACGL